MSNSINQFMTAFAGGGRFALHLPVLWSVTIDGVDIGAINTAISGAGERWRANTSPSSLTRSGDLLVASEVTIPSESATMIAMTSGSNMGGFLPAYGVQSRTDFLSRSFNINFIETEGDIEHNFIRPWMIAIGIRGLIGSQLKSTIEVKQYTNSGNLMKGYRFTKAFPTNVEGMTLNYDSTDFKYKSVTFACHNYEQL